MGAPAAQRRLKSAGAPERSAVHAGELATLVRVNRRLGFRLASPNGHEQGLQHEFSCPPTLHGPARHTLRLWIDANSQRGEAFLRSDLGDVGPSDPVGRIAIEPPIQGGGDNHRRLGATAAGATPKPFPYPVAGRALARRPSRAPGAQVVINHPPRPEVARQAPPKPALGR
jgi:hypothetical protein